MCVRLLINTCAREPFAESGDSAHANCALATMLAAGCLRFCIPLAAYCETWCPTNASEVSYELIYRCNSAMVPS
jgi:hypothetical protein